MKNIVCLFLFIVCVSFQTLANNELVKRGDYLVNGIVACGNCHTPKGGPLKDKELAGTFLADVPPFKAFAPNITQDKATGIGSWTDEQIIRSIRDGIRPDGSLIGLPMPFEFYRHISDYDVRAIVAYLRTVKPVDNELPNSEYRISLPPSWGPKVGHVPEVSRADKVAYGAYLAGPLGHCIECNTPFENGHFDFQNRLGAGGHVFDGPWGISVSRNITSHPTDGLGNWSDQDVILAITKGIGKDGRKLLPPMGYHYYANINDADMDAIVTYLRSLPAKNNQ
jgi:mono/diheme cytochrome c family protein